MAQKEFDGANLAALAAEACDLWQEHLTACAADADARAEVMRLLEPQRQIFCRLFADYAAMMQTASYADISSSGPHSASARPAAAAQAAAPERAATSGAAPAASSSDDGALRLAQLAHRMAELEKRVERLEQRGAAKTARAAGAAKSGNNAAAS